MPAKFVFNGEGRSIYCASGYGPTWGGQADLPDLAVSTNSNRNKKSYTNLFSSYGTKEDEKLFDKFYMSGAFKFQTIEIEVFAMTS